MVDEFGTPKAFERNVELEYAAQRRALRVPEMGQRARSTISRSSRRAPASATRSTSNISRSASGRASDANGETVAYPGHSGRHRQPHDDGQRPWRARLGRWRYRGRGGDARPAGVDAHPGSRRLPPAGELPEGITATDLVLTVTQMLRAKGVVGRFVEFYGPGPRRADARRPRDHRQHGARIWRDLRLLPDRRADHRLSAS